MIPNITDSKIKRRFENVASSKTFQNILSTYRLERKSVLDIGCTYGEFLCHFGPQSTGLTIIKEEADFGREHGLDIRAANVEDPATVRLEHKYDVIFANNIFEHMLSPHTFLISIKKYLKQEGILILGVPCLPKITSLVRLKRFRGSLASLHINFLTRDTLIKTVEAGGWEVLTCRGFHFRSSSIDSLVNFIWPHFYVVSRPVPDFEYSGKRAREVAGYQKP